jgi:prepilin-type N-terminal cleavage/methylation domain-containing protein/prepilin-type processing-associated H-X9-DG protein
MKKHASAFTLIELLVTITIIAALAALVMMMIPQLRLRGRMAASLSNMRQIGAAFQLYANDNDFSLPKRVRDGDKWPRLLVSYLGDDPKVYAEPGNSENYLLTHSDPLSNGHNNTSYIMNGYNDLGAYEDPEVTVKTNNVDQPSKTILLSVQSGTGNFYMDFVEGNDREVLNLKAYGSGANYLFMDGSARFLKVEDYDREMWKLDKSNTTL